MKADRLQLSIVMSTVEWTVWGAVGAKGSKEYDLKGSGKKGPWW